MKSKCKEVFIFFLFICLIFSFSCAPSLGASWYAKSGKKGSRLPMYITSIEVAGQEVEISDAEYRAVVGGFAKAKRFSALVPFSVSSVSIDDIKIEAYENEKKEKRLNVSLEIEGDSVPLTPSESVSLTLRVTEESGKYKVEERFISVLRDEAGEADGPQSSGDGEGGGAGGDGAGEGGAQGGGTSELPKVDNPKDEHGNEKYIVKFERKEENINPFDWYKEDSSGFSASKFNDWILNMTGINSQNVASYTFKPGTWSGNPLSCTGDDIGSGFNKVWNLKYYKYASQKERWAESSGFSPSMDDAEKSRRERFLFFRFTGSTSGPTLDNSMFCVDTHSKFLFYYSSPASIIKIGSAGLPSNWKDYEQGDEGEHKHFSQPFYMSDPVGYVEESGNCVIYSWCKNHIKNNNYRPPVDSKFRKKARRSGGGAGYSPYKDSIKKVTTKTDIKPNPKYTAEKPVILTQPEARYWHMQRPDNAILSVRAKEVPKGESLSYQWYKSADGNIDNRELVSGATSHEYVVPKAVTDVYYFCVLVNTNGENGKTAKTISNVVKVRIAENEADLRIDADAPDIIEHPKSGSYYAALGDTLDISLSVEVRQPADGGTLSYQWFKNSIYSTDGATEISGASEKTYKITNLDYGTKYYYCRVTNTSSSPHITGERSVFRYSVIAEIKIQALGELDVSCAGDGELKVFGAENGSSIVLRDGQQKVKVKIPCNLLFLAQEDRGWAVEWEGELPGNISISEDRRIAQLKIENVEQIKDKSISAVFKKIPKVGKFGITEARVENIDLGGKYALRFYDYAFFWWSVSVSAESDEQILPAVLWNQDSHERLYKQGFGKSSYFMPPANAKYMDLNINNDRASVKLDLEMTKSDSPVSFLGDHEWKMVGRGKGAVEFEYDAVEDCWRVKDVNYNIDKVSVSYKKDFILKRGWERDFTVTYKADNPDLYATGVIKVVYRLTWE